MPAGGVEGKGEVGSPPRGGADSAGALARGSPPFYRGPHGPEPRDGARRRASPEPERSP
jgi:hypothetical protein